MGREPEKSTCQLHWQLHPDQVCRHEWNVEWPKDDSVSCHGSSIADDRVTVLADQTRGITGIGDAPSPKDAEKLAALSAVLQLQAAGLVSQVSPRIS